MGRRLAKGFTFFILHKWCKVFQQSSVESHVRTETQLENKISPWDSQAIYIRLYTRSVQVVPATTDQQLKYWLANLKMTFKMPEAMTSCRKCPKKFFISWNTSTDAAEGRRRPVWPIWKDFRNQSQVTQRSFMKQHKAFS